MFYIVYYLGLCLFILSGTMLLPLIIAIIYNEANAFYNFFLISFLLLFFSGGILFALRGRSLLDRRHSKLLLLVLVWSIVPAAAALPFYFLAMPVTYNAAYFEAVSGFTTTGASVIKDPADLPRSLLVWRSLLNWLGGLMTYVIIALLLRPLSGPEVFGKEMRSIIPATNPSNNDNIKDAIKAILPIYSTLTITCLVLLVLIGMEPLHALCLSFSAVSTGGFMPISNSLSIYGLPMAEIVLAVFMFLGAVSLLWVEALVQLRWRSVFSVKEPFWILLFIFLLGSILTVMIWDQQSNKNFYYSFRTFFSGIVAATSFISTTGFPVNDGTQHVIPYVMMLVIIIVGGGRFSTAGGIKFFRIGEMFRLSYLELRRLVFPHSVSALRHGSQIRERNVMQSVWTNFTVVIFFICLIAIILSATGLPITNSFIASAGALGNFGPIYELYNIDAAADKFEYGNMTAVAHWILCLGMILGRVEVLAVLTIFNLEYWRG